MTALKYWPVILVILILVVSAIAHRCYKLAVLSAAAILVVFNLAPVSDAMGLAGFALILFFGIGFISLIDKHSFRTVFSATK